MGTNYTHLSIEERTMIQTQLSIGFKPGQIARELGRSTATLSRELKRNGCPYGEVSEQCGISID